MADSSLSAQQPESASTTQSLLFVESQNVAVGVGDAINIAEKSFDVAVCGRHLHPASVIKANIAFTEDDLDKEKDRLGAIFKGRELAGIVALDDDALQLAAKVVQHPLVNSIKGAPTDSLLNAAKCLDKFYLRSKLAKKAIGAVRFISIESEDELKDRLSEVGFPCVLKPRFGTNSQHVYYCADESELKTNIRSLFADGRGGALVEEYLEGPEFSIDAFTINGTTTVMAVAQKNLGPLPYFVELGFCIPTMVSQAVEKEIVDGVLEAHSVLGLNNTITHSEVRVTSNGPRILEINPRPPGGRLREFIRATTGYDVLEAAICSAAGVSPSVADKRAPAGVYECLTTKLPSLIAFDASYSCPALPVGIAPLLELEVTPGATVYPVNDPRGRVLGRLLVYGRTLDEALDEAHGIWNNLGVSFIPIQDASFPNEASSDGCDASHCDTPGAWKRGCC